VLELDDVLGCFGWGGRPGRDLPASFRVLFEELEGVGVEAASVDEEVPPP
jgi:hypothetical protein